MVLRHFPLDLLTGEEHVHELAVGGARPELLNLAHLRLEAAIDPGQHLVPEEDIFYPEESTQFVVNTGIVNSIIEV